jgi:hypothetical protein
MAFHEKAGWSQVGFVVFSLDEVFPAESPLSPPFPPHSSLSVFWLGQLGVLVSAGAATCLSTSRSIRKNESWARRLTQSPELGAGAFPF